MWFWWHSHSHCARNEINWRRKVGSGGKQTFSFELNESATWHIENYIRRQQKANKFSLIFWNSSTTHLVHQFFEEILLAKSWVKQAALKVVSYQFRFFEVFWRYLDNFCYSTEQAILCFLGVQIPPNPAMSSPPVAILWSPPIFATLLADWHWMHKRLVWRPQMACAGRIYGNIAVYEQLQLAIRRHHFIS